MSGSRELRDYTFYLKEKCLKTAFLNAQLVKQAYRNGCDDNVVVVESGSGGANAASSYDALLIGATITPVEELETTLLNSTCPDPTIPSEPLFATAIAGNGQVDISFAASETDGGSPIISYSVIAMPGEFVVDGSGSPLTITGLTNGVAYTISLVAVNSIGSSAAVSLGPVTPSAPAPVGGLAFAFDPASNVSGNTLTTTGPLSVTGAMTNVTYNAAEGGGALYFNGSNAYIAFPQTNFGNAITICAWVKPEDEYSINTIIANTIAGQAPSGFKMGWNGWQTTNRRMYFEGGNSISGNALSTNQDNLVTFNTWQHLAYVLDIQNRTINFYYNGVLQEKANTNLTAASIGTNREFRIGSFMLDSYHMKGYIGEFFMYNAVLDATDVTTNFNDTKTRYGF